MIHLESIKNGINIGRKALKKCLPTILIWVGLAGGATATIVAIKATPAAHEELEEQKAEEEQIADMLDREPKKDIWARTKIIAKHYWPTATLMIVSGGCIIFANCAHLKREAALVAAYGMTQKNLTDLREKIVEIDGKKKLQQLTDSIAEKDLKDNPNENNTVIVTGNGDHLCYDSWSGRYFKTNIEKVRRAELDLNKALLHDGYYSVNDFYESLDLPVIELGGLLGWHAGSQYDQVEINFSSKVTETGEPCLVIRFDKMPEYEFDEFG